MHRPVLVTPPATTPVTLQELKQHLRLVAGAETYTTEDGPLQIYLEAAVAHLDGYTGILGRCLVTQTWRQDFDGWGRTLRLPLLAAGISSVKYRDSDGQLATVSSDDYALKSDDLGGYVRFDDGFAFPGDLAETNAVLIEFTAGYGAAADVPAALKAAVLLLAGDLYANRAAKTDGGVIENPAVAALIGPYRRVRF